MRTMKDSGIEWIGEIPEDWEIIKFKYLHSGSNVGVSIDKELWTTDQNDTIFYTAGLVPITTKYKNFPKEKYTSHSDLLLARNGTPYVYFPEPNAMYSDHIIRVKIRDNYCKKFIWYCLQKSISFEIVDTVSISTWSVSVWDKQILCIPLLAEQQKISAFLDRKCTEIDSVISKTKATIEEYKKLKQSVITQAVTKGIIPNRPMKDSGIEWIGEIPQEWKLIPFRYVLKERNEKNSPIKSYERLSLSIDLGVTTYSEKTTNLDRFKEDFEQYKLAHIGDLVMNSMNMIVGATGVSDYYGCVSPVYYTFYDETENHITAKFCEYIFRSKAMLRVLYSLGKGIYAIVRGDDRVNTCRLKVAKEDLKSLKIPLPTVQEQQEIVNYLDEKCSEIDKLIAKKEQLLTEMENYKKAVIYEYVTGKREIVDKIVFFHPIINVANKEKAVVSLICKIIDFLGNDLKGRTELLKAFCSIENVLGINFHTQYYRFEHGPFNKVIYEYEKLCQNMDFIKLQEKYNKKSMKKSIVYMKNKKFSTYKKDYLEIFGDLNNEIERILKFLKGMNTTETERVATLLYSWNDFIIDGNNKPFDAEIIYDVRKNWTPNKEHSPETTWQETLNKMKEARIVPNGYGLHTKKKGV